MLVESRYLRGQHEREQQDESENLPVLRETVLSEAVSHASYEIVSRLIPKSVNVHGLQEWHSVYLFAIEHGKKM